MKNKQKGQVIMNKLYLKEPTIEDKDNVIEMCKEFEKIISYLNNSYSIEKIKVLILNNPTIINITLEEFINIKDNL